MKSLTLIEAFNEMSDELLIGLSLTNPRSVIDLCILLSCDIQLEKEIEEIDENLDESVKIDEDVLEEIIRQVWESEEE